jgi:hypothetical protein
MDEGRGEGGLSFLGRQLAPAFVVRLITLPPGEQRGYVNEEWSDALVVVERGAVELESPSGARRLFVSGDVLRLDRLPMRVLRNHGRLPVLLSAVSRRTASGLGSQPDRARPIPFPGTGV